MNGKQSAEVMAPKETYLELMKTMRKMAKHTIAAYGLIPMTIPNDVATPFPPRKLAKMGKTCPTTALNAPQS